MNANEWYEKSALKVAKNALKTEVEINGETTTIDGALKKLEEMIPKWISVKDSIPRSMANRVIVFCTSDEVNDWIGFGHMEIENGFQVWYNLENGKPFEEIDLTVTHWMELPNAPTNEEKVNGID